MIEMNLQIRNRLTDLKNELMVAAEWETGVRDLGSLDGQLHSATLKQTTNKDLLCSTGNSVQHNVTA